jgi:peptidoglycan/LPS O-acetylase OafA/YrhL
VPGMAGTSGKLSPTKRRQKRTKWSSRSACTMPDLAIRPRRPAIRMNTQLLRPTMYELNSLRGLACLAVLFFHGFWWYIPESATGAGWWLRLATQGGYRGVNLFFVLSGLLITNILVKSRSRPDYFTTFYTRRALRILPAYYMVLALLAVYGVSHGFLMLSVLYLSNMAPLLGVEMSYGPLWSLAVEEQFYLLWPLFIRRFSTRTLVVLAVGSIITSAILTLQLHTSSPKATMPIWYAAHGLALGALLAIFLRSRFGSRSNATIMAALLSIFGTTAITAPAIHMPATVLTAQAIGWDLIFAATLLFALLGGSSRYERFLRPKLLQFFGDISYGLYLIHVFVFMVYRGMFVPGNGLPQILLQFLVCSLVATGLATLSRFTVEEWFLAQKEKLSPRIQARSGIPETL